MDVKTLRKKGIPPGDLLAGETIILDTDPPCPVTVLSIDRRAQKLRVRDRETGDLTVWFHELRGACRPRAARALEELRKAA